MFELHVWGPAFGLPSIDPHCLAAIAYLQQAVPAGKWVVTASSNPTISPTYELPALRDGDIWIGGFRNIFHYLAQHSSGKWILDVGLSEQEGADCIAFSSFLDSTARLLLDLSLYVSIENYSKVTRPAYSNLQPFPLPYLMPDAIRSTARSRTQNLGLASFNIDREKDSINNSSKSISSIIPENLRRSKHTVSSLVTASPECVAQIRLNALAIDCLEPIENLRAKKRYLVSDVQITSLDCLALGYLSLMLIPELPQSWLAKTMRQKFPRLSAWTQELRTEIFGGAVGCQDVFSDRKKGDWGDRLPWQKSETENIWSRGQVFFLTMFDDLKGFGRLRRKDKMRSYTAKKSDNRNVWNTSSKIFTTLSAVFLTGATAGIGMILLSLFKTDHRKIKNEKFDNNKLNSFGDAGKILGAYSQEDEFKLL
ncbi:putative mitochondrial import receptor subunit [Erysiphe necator]|uniref:Putative mitochondrial import receptor subunit n=1 Tax=Uncinula necator TaxID=52586 RepID=A0A0B1PBD1_UNCNE|nr:putative mitochondrial import receptor subunit [Erysiphe necator]